MIYNFLTANPRGLSLLNLYWLLNCCTSCCGQCTMMYNFQSINQCDKTITHFFQDVHEMHHSKKLYITYRAHDVQLFFMIHFMYIPQNSIHVMVQYIILTQAMNNLV